MCNLLHTHTRTHALNSEGFVIIIIDLPLEDQYEWYIMNRRASHHPLTGKLPKNLARLLLLVGPRRKKTDRHQRSASPSEPPRFKPLNLAHKGYALP